MSDHRITDSRPLAAPPPTVRSPSAGSAAGESNGAAPPSVSPCLRYSVVSVEDGPGADSQHADWRRSWTDGNPAVLRPKHRNLLKLARMGVAFRLPLCAVPMLV